MGKQIFYMFFILFGIVLLANTQAVAADNRWYITPGVSHIVVDGYRQADNSLGFQIGIGKPITESFNLELNFVGDTLDPEAPPPEFKQKGVLVDGLHFFSRHPKFSTYGVAGGGMLETEYNNVKETSPTINVGAGIMSRLWKDRLGFRSDIRYRLDEDDNLGKIHFNDWLLNVNLVLPLGASTPVVKDGDKDGIVDAQDMCPSTPMGEPVNESGCPRDSDRDGVPDPKDMCPGTPNGTMVDAKGCVVPPPAPEKSVAPTPPPVVKDSDGDGVLDSKDSCPNTPIGTAIDVKGCALPPPPPIVKERDSDGDGVLDKNDTCPATPAGVMVNKNGCPLDGDGDSIADYLDKCPASPAGEKVDETGCKIAEVIVLKGVNFATNSDAFAPGTEEQLNVVAQTLRRYPDMVVEVAGYTDSSGKADKNKALSQKRADAVANYLASKGANSANLKAKGYGIENPIGDNNTPDGKSLNRRVELHILSQLLLIR